MENFYKGQLACKEKSGKDPYHNAPIGQKTIIISYDIPEEYRRGHSWLRGVLKLLDYEMVHRVFGWQEKISI